MTVGVIEAQMQPERAQGRVRLRHHLRHELRVRLRLPARQPRDRARGDRPARRTPSRSWTRSTRSSIDEARTPLIIAGPARGGGRTPTTRSRKIVKGLKLGEDYEVDEKRKTAAPTEQGVSKVEKALGIENLYAPGSSQMVNHLIQALRAESLYSSGVEYLVRRRRGQDRRRVHRPHHGGPPLVGGPAPGRRGQGGRQDRGRERHGRDGHDPELLPPLREARRHDRHGAHRGQRVPRDLRPRGRADPDQRAGHAHRPERPHLQDRGREVPRRRRTTSPSATPTGQPVLVGTISVEVSERVSEPARAQGHPAQRAQRQAPGRRARRPRSSRTPARGARSRSRPTWPAAASTSSSARACSRLGGLYVIGTERHESRRIDNQLRGRSGRQGDPGETRFFLSAEDQLVRLFAGDRIFTILDKLGPGEDQPIEHKMLTKRIEGAQKRVEEMHFDMRKQVLKYDDVLNKQREVIYAERRGVLEGEDMQRADPRVDRRGRRGHRRGAHRVERSPRSGISTGSSPACTRSSRSRSTREDARPGRRASSARS